MIRDVTNNDDKNRNIRLSKLSSRFFISTNHQNQGLGQQWCLFLLITNSTSQDLETQDSAAPGWWPIRWQRAPHLNHVNLARAHVSCHETLTGATPRTTIMERRGAVPANKLLLKRTFSHWDNSNEEDQNRNAIEETTSEIVIDDDERTIDEQQSSLVNTYSTMFPIKRNLKSVR